MFTEADWFPAQWIRGTNPINDQPLFRTSFSVPQSKLKSISSARLFITGLGVYEAFINGVRVGDLQLAPGWTTYSERVFYDTYDVTGQISHGNNTVGIAVGRYWFGGIYDWGPAADYGAWDGNMRAKAQLLITYSDGSNQTVVTDSSWKTHISGTNRDRKNTTHSSEQIFENASYFAIFTVNNGPENINEHATYLKEACNQLQAVDRGRQNQVPWKIVQQYVASTVALIGKNIQKDITIIKNSVGLSTTPINAANFSGGRAGTATWAQIAA
ncbi:hypothetical protein N7507_010401 [Penicillium longicatenatum]|nr:hypothetical protein N7507_010401 [Penicillium longicatenatum]